MHQSHPSVFLDLVQDRTCTIFLVVSSFSSPDKVLPRSFGFTWIPTGRPPLYPTSATRRLRGYLTEILHQLHQLLNANIFLASNGMQTHARFLLHLQVTVLSAQEFITRLLLVMTRDHGQSPARDSLDNPPSSDDFFFVHWFGLTYTFLHFPPTSRIIPIVKLVDETRTKSRRVER